MFSLASWRYNLKYNTERVQQPEFGKMINGQGMGLVSKLRYGICTMSFNGCEVIAVHNALVYLNNPKALKDIAFYMERFRLLMGFFGCNVYMLGKALQHFDAVCPRISSIDDAEAFIITFWTKQPFLSSIHTVFCVKTQGGIQVYNRYNNVDTMYLCTDVEEIAGKRPPIAIYKIK